MKIVLGVIAEVLDSVVMVIVACPMPPGDTTTIDVPAEFTSPEEIWVFPNVTVEFGENPAPLMVTCVPPSALPELGLMPVMTGT